MYSNFVKHTEKFYVKTQVPLKLKANIISPIKLDSKKNTTSM